MSVNSAKGSKIDIEICRDIQKEYNYHRKDFMSNNIMGFNYKVKEQIKEKRELFKETDTNFSSKEFYIIQSNSTYINICLHIFDNGKIIIQADPYASGIFKINHEKHFEEKVRIYKDNKKEFMEQLFTKTN